MSVLGQILGQCVVEKEVYVVSGMTDKTPLMKKVSGALRRGNTVTRPETCKYFRKFFSSIQCN